MGRVGPRGAIFGLGVRSLWRRAPKACRKLRLWGRVFVLRAARGLFLQVMIIGTDELSILVLRVVSGLVFGFRAARNSVMTGSLRL